jgi:hypothetical protein
MKKVRSNFAELTNSPGRALVQPEMPKGRKASTSTLRRAKQTEEQQEEEKTKAQDRRKAKEDEKKAELLSLLLDIANSMMDPESAAEIIARTASLSSLEKVELTVAIITMLLEHQTSVKMVATVFCNIKAVNIL